MTHTLFPVGLLVIVTIITKVSCVDPLHPDLVTDVPYEDCGSQYASLTYLKVTPPCGPERCPVNRGENSTVEIQFMPRLNSSILRVTFEQVDPTFGFSTILFPVSKFLWDSSTMMVAIVENILYMLYFGLKERNFCGRRNISCPIIASQLQYPYVVDTMPRHLPPLNMILKVRAESDDYKSFLCIIARLSIVWY